MNGPDSQRVPRPFVFHPPASEKNTIGDWVAVMEYAHVDADRRFAPTEIEDLVGLLREWHPTVLWSEDRFAIQLQLPAENAPDALTWAFARLGGAVVAAGLPSVTFVRLEILTLEEAKRDGVRMAPPARTVAPATIDVAVTTEGDETWHVTADSDSISSLVVEEPLPAMLSEAMLTLGCLRPPH